MVVYGSEFAMVDSATPGFHTRPPATASPESVSVRVSTGWSIPAPAADAADLTGGAKPWLWLGATAEGGLILPAAMPTADQLYAPRAVWLDDHYLIAADTGNHRVLIWNNPDTLGSHQEADVVLGQPDFSTEGAQAGGRGPNAGMRLPTGLIVDDGRLIVADAWNHRILIWDDVPSVSDTPPDLILGQADATSVDENRGCECGPTTMYWPFGVAVIDGRFWVADTGNRRVLVWDEVPSSPDAEPAFVLGQPDGYSRDENRGEIGADSFRWPHDMAGNDQMVLVADAGNHRILGWNPPPSADGAAQQILGQPDDVTAIEVPYEPQSGTTLRFPYAIDIDFDADLMAVADTANNRVLLWDGVPTDSQTSASRVLGQVEFNGIGENRWDLVGDDTFCWPYGLCLHRGRLAVADSGNNRIMVWDTT